jgi:hypothetical protein
MNPPIAKKNSLEYKKRFSKLKTRQDGYFEKKNTLRKETKNPKNYGPAKVVYLFNNWHDYIRINAGRNWMKI